MRPKRQPDAESRSQSGPDKARVKGGVRRASGSSPCFLVIASLTTVSCSMAGFLCQPQRLILPSVRQSAIDIRQAPDEMRRVGQDLEIPTAKHLR